MKQGKNVKITAPEEILQDSNFMSIFRMACLTVISIIIVNYIVFIFLNSSPQNRAYWLLREKWKRLEALDKPVDMLVLGDSSCSMGVDPVVLEEKLGMSVMNLCTFGGVIAVNDAWMLQRYIEKHGPPKEVLIVHAYDIWADGANMWVLAKIPQKWGYWRRFEPRLSGSPAASARILLGRFVPFFTENRTMADLLKSPRSMLSRKFVMTEKGMTPVEEANPDNVKEDFEGQLEQLRNSGEFMISNPNRNALDAIEHLADKHGFNVFLANSPVYEGLPQSQIYRDYFSQVEMSLGELSAAREHIHYIPGQLSYGKNMMENTDHLIISAAVVYTSEIADYIAAH